MVPSVARLSLELRLFTEHSSDEVILRWLLPLFVYCMVLSSVQFLFLLKLLNCGVIASAKTPLPGTYGDAIFVTPDQPPRSSNYLANTSGKGSLLLLAKRDNAACPA